MVQYAKVLVDKPDNLSSISKTHMLEREVTPTCCSLTSTSTLRT